MTPHPRLFAWTILIAVLCLSACIRAERLPPPPTDRATFPPAAAPTSTATASPTATRRPTRTPHPTRIPSLTPTNTLTRVPGPTLRFLALQGGSVWRYNAQTWSAEKVGLPANGDIWQAASTATGEYLAYWDEEGLKLSRRPFTTFTLLATNPAEWGNGLVFNDAVTLLAYSDAKGLHTYNLEDGSQELLLTHDEEPPEGCKFYYIPYRWSPDSRWLAIDTSCIDGGVISLYDRQTHTLHEFPAEQCPDELNWSAQSGRIMFNVYYSGYRGCGEQDGIYVLSTPTGNPIANARRIFSETTPPEPEGRGTYHPGWHPNGEWISFVQVAYPESNRLLLVKPDGSQLQVLTSTAGNIGHPLWSPDGKWLFYTESAQNIRTLHRVDIATWEARRYGEIPDGYPLTFSPEGNWLVLEGASFWLMNVIDGKVYTTELADTAEWLGWEIP